MTAEIFPASLASRFAVANPYNVPQGYYRSKLFIVSSTTNPLVAAAGPLLSLLERLGISPTLPPVQEIRDNIEHELQAFHSRLVGQQYAEELILVARYLLSATIDELLGKNYLRLNGQPAEFKAFTPLSQDNSGPQQRFFEIIHYIKDRINQYLDLLELSYYCLTIGFEGEHHLRADGRQALDNLIEELFQLIQTHRVNKPYRLFKEPSPLTSAPKGYRHLWMAMTIAIGAMFFIYGASHLLLEHKAKTVLLGHSVLASLDN